jgi:uncharacterized protein YbjT (DUF2867 family)
MKESSVFYHCEDLPTKPVNKLGRVLVTGATGYIGGRLVPILISRGYQVRVMVRSHNHDYLDRFKGAEVSEAEGTDSEALLAALDGVHTAYYFLHSLRLGNKRFEQVDIEIAGKFRRAAEAKGVKRIIYLTGLGNEKARLSPHLENRMRVANVLRDGPIPVTLLRAGMIIGSGSASYEILRHLVKNTPVFFIPRWAKTKGQPIAIRDVMKYLVGVLEIPETAGHSFDIGGKDILTYDEMLKELARLLGLRRIFLPALITWTRLYGYIASLLTPVPGPITRVLIEGCRNEVVCRNLEVRSFLNFEPLTYKEALLMALNSEEYDKVQTRWSDAWPPDHELATQLHQLETSPRFISSYVRLTRKTCAGLFASFCQVGGRDGWFHHNWMWRMRGALDRIMEGVGTLRGRRSLDTLRVNDVIGFWRVENIQQDRLLLLRAEMKLPGLAWLEFISEDAQGVRRLSVTAYFKPKGIAGWLYWYLFLPFHGVLFTKLLKDIETKAS